MIRSLLCSHIRRCHRRSLVIRTDHAAAQQNDHSRCCEETLLHVTLSDINPLFLHSVAFISVRVSAAALSYQSPAGGARDALPSTRLEAFFSRYHVAS